ncbi:unnamed protein product [Peniophora sp. CBMAI 1063]|nr:unnamed protein product [Peniophora sp. CBMAI 1063]
MTSTPPHQYSDFFIPELPVNSLRELCAEDTLACCIPVGTPAFNPSAGLSTLFFRLSDRCDSWSVTPSSTSVPAMNQKIVFEPALEDASFQLGWNGMLSQLPDAAAYLPAVKFALGNGLDSDVFILRRDCLTDISIPINSRQSPPLQGCDIIALRLSTGAWHHYVFRDLVQMFPEAIVHERFDMLKVIGRGAYGAVFLAKRRAAPGDLVAIKRQHWAADNLDMADICPPSSRRNEAVYLETMKATGGIEYLCKILEPEIISIASALTVDEYDSIRKESFAVHCMILEYREGGTLRNFIRWSGNKSLSESEMRYFGRQILKGLMTLHGNDFIHRDLKIDNLLVRYTPKKSVVTPVVIGKNVKRQREDEIGMTFKVGTVGWFPPELDSLGQGNRTHKSDVWTAGLILVALLTNNFKPRHGIKLADIQILDSDDFSSQCREVLKGLLQDLPEDRISIADALASPWFSAADSMYTIFPGLTDGHVAGPIDNSSLTAGHSYVDATSAAAGRDQSPDATIRAVAVHGHDDSVTPVGSAVCAVPTMPLESRLQLPREDVRGPVIAMASPDVLAVSRMDHSNSDAPDRTPQHSLFSAQSSLSVQDAISSHASLLARETLIARSIPTARSHGLTSVRGGPGGRYGHLRPATASASGSSNAAIRRPPARQKRVNSLEVDEELENSMDLTA